LRVYTDFDLTDYNAYRLPARCKSVVFPDTEQDVVNFFSNNSDYILLGSGHNVILSKEYYDTTIVIFHNNFNKVSVNETIIEAEAGATILEVSEVARESALTGVEFYYDIPSSVGGAVVMNAGTKEGETQNVLMKVRYLDLTDMKIKERYKNELQLEYRNSLFQKQNNKIITKAWFQLQHGNPEDITRVMEESKARRWAKQPREYPNCGSVYKRPPGRFVGPMLDELGLKGYRIGGAEISRKHSGFIINVGNATGADILGIIKHTREKVKEKFSVDLEVEQRVI
jgi:UDP-N-acetylmuramate dehydrogenase